MILRMNHLWTHVVVSINSPNKIVLVDLKGFKGGKVLMGNKTLRNKENQDIKPLTVISFKARYMPTVNLNLIYDCLN